MAGRRASVEVEDEDDKGVVILDGGAVAVASEDPEQARIRKIRSALAAGQHASLRVHRMVTGKGRCYLDTLKLSDEEVADFKEVVKRSFEGGDYFVEFRVGGMIQGSESFTILGEPAPLRRPIGSVEAPLAQVPVPTLEAKPALDAEAIEARIAARITAEYEKREEIREREALRRENDELKARLAAPQAPAIAPQSVTTQATELVDKIFEKVAGLTKRANTEADPRLAALETENKANREKLEAMEKASAKRELDEVKASNKAILDTLEEMKAKKPGKKKSGASEVLKVLMEAALTEKALDKLSEKAAESETGLLSTVIDAASNELRGPLVAAVKAGAKHLSKRMAKAAKKVAASQQPGAASVPGSWQEWIEHLILNPAKVEDKAFVRASVQKFPEQLTKLSKVNDKPALLVFVLETLGQANHDHVSKWPDDQVAGLLTIIGKFRATAQAVASEPPPPPETEPEEDDQDDEDEGDEDDDEDDEEEEAPQS